MVFWDEVFQEVAVDFPTVETESLLVDRACMDFVRWPEDFDVVVASNLFADILSDIAAVVTGSMGLAPSANINPERLHPSMFEPVHGSAPDIHGSGIANPIATVWSGAMMCEHLGEGKGSKRLKDAISKITQNGTILPRDLGGKSSTAAVAEAIVDCL